MNKKLIRLTESDLHRIIKESVKKIIEGKKVNNKPYFYKFPSPYDDYFGGYPSYKPGEEIPKGYNNSYKAYDERKYVSSPGGGERVQHKDLKGIEKHNERAKRKSNQ